MICVPRGSTWSRLERCARHPAAPRFRPRELRLVSRLATFAEADRPGREGLPMPQSRMPMTTAQVERMLYVKVMPR